MFDWIINFELNSLLGIALYWSPLLLCIVGYTIRTFDNYLKDKRRREANHSEEHIKSYGITAGYVSTDTIGTLIGRAFVSFIPIANLWAACFDIAPKLFEKFFKYLDKIFNIPLVPDTEKYESLRKNKREEYINRTKPGPE